MIKIVFPSYSFKVKKENEKEWIFDEIRKQWVRLTPEEWVRQNFIRYLIDEKMYPASLIAIEKEIKLNDLNKRCDIVVYNRQLQPWLMVECKSMNEVLNEKASLQILRYQVALPVIYLIITNGQYCYGLKRVDNELKEINELPDYAS
ncbi:MAG TPA: type I restriction enzyme HsdR N-terminal domain-containing protein [Chitinophagaceae bacterium]|nr:type I restriction enzyme HsdR N-terminal domain-containing protein [Chitinophagaceae bacterium]